MKHREIMSSNKRYSSCIKQMEDMVSVMKTEKPIERIRTLEQKINEVDEWNRKSSVLCLWKNCGCSGRYRAKVICTGSRHLNKSPITNQTGK